MGIWFFLTVVVGGNMALKAYKFRASLGERSNPKQMRQIERELQELREELASQNKRVELLEEAVFFGDFELKQKFNKLESDFHARQGKF
jgi:hypothetical protein